MCSRTSIPLPPGGGREELVVAVVAAKRTESAEHIMDVQSSIIFPSALQSAP